MPEFLTLHAWLRARDESAPLSDIITETEPPCEPVDAEDIADLDALASEVRRFRALLGESFDRRDLDDALLRQAIDCAERMLAWRP